MGGGLSIFATVLSSITYMAIPGLGYGTNWNLFLQNSYVIILPLVALVYLPFYRRLNLTCAYEYLEQRFNVGDAAGGQPAVHPLSVRPHGDRAVPARAGAGHRGQL